MSAPLVAEKGATYTITGPGGTRAVLNDPDDVDFVGYLTEPPSGLTDDAELRFASEARAEQDGAVITPTFLAERQFTLTGFINVDPAAARNIAQDKLRRAASARRGDGLIEWTSSDGQRFSTAFRAQQPTRFTNARPRNFLVAGACADPRIYGATVRTANVVIANPASSGGGSFPLSFPLSFEGGVAAVTAALAVNNAGLSEEEGGFAPVTLAVKGPVVGPLELRNTTVGKKIRIDIDLSADDTLTVNTADKSIVLNGMADRRTYLDYLSTNWWGLAPGNNNIELAFASFAAGAQLTASWRDAWL